MWYRYQPALEQQRATTRAIHYPTATCTLSPHVIAASKNREDWMYYVNTVIDVFMQDSLDWECTSPKRKGTCTVAQRTHSNKFCLHRTKKTGNKQSNTEPHPRTMSVFTPLPHAIRFSTCKGDP